MAKRGFGIAGALDHEIIKQVARAVEASGYASFWVNDTPNGDGLAALKVAAEVTSTITLAVGVIPVDRRLPDEITNRVRALDLPLNRLIIGIGSGSTRKGGLALVRAAAVRLTRDLGVPVVVGALGPRMCRLSAEHADGALLNWLTPGKAGEAGALIRAAATASGRLEPFVAGYVRTALGESSRSRLQEEAARYERIPQYARHFAAMGVSAVDTSIICKVRDEIQTELGQFDAVLDETVVRAITPLETAEHYVALVHAASP
ncbi:MAG: LLM class flavin-dependent oxidoreductase [Thermomicrobiales bacterium]